MIAQLQTIEVVTLFTQDLAAARAFYDAVFGAEVVYEDDHSTVLRFGTVMINLLASTEAPTLVQPLPARPASAGAAFIVTIKVDDVDATARELGRQGVALLNGPLDRPWGRRTAAFVDPDGFVWEIAHDLPRPPS